MAACLDKMEIMGVFMGVGVVEVVLVVDMVVDIVVDMVELVEAMASLSILMVKQLLGYLVIPESMVASPNFNLN
jgi:hypothetical protein